MSKKTKETENNNEVFQGNPFEVAGNAQQEIYGNEHNPNTELINAINVLIAAINIAQSKGAYNIEEAGEIWNNIQKIHTILQA